MRYEQPRHHAHSVHTTLLVAEDAEHYQHARPPGGAPPDRRALEGRAIRNAIALVKGADISAGHRQDKVESLRVTMLSAAGASATPEDPAELEANLRRLARVSDSGLAEQLRLLRRFDELQLWNHSGCRDCAMWLDRHLGISRISALERMRVTRALAELPLMEALFAVGSLTWSKVREMTRVADEACEHELCAAVLDLSVTETIAVCRRWHWREEDQQSREFAEAAAARQAFEQRGLSARMKDPTTMRITLDLPIELGAEFMKSIECQQDLEPSTASASVSRADAAVQLSRKAIAFEGEACAASDRYRVLVSLDARVLADEPCEDGPERPSIIGWGPIAVSTARRLAQISSLSVTALDANGQVAGTGRSTRLCSNRMLRAIRTRDRCCSMPGCDHTRWTHAHHIIPWAEGGKTEPGNLTLLCSDCHRRVHDEGLRLEAVDEAGITLDDAQGCIVLSAADARRARARIKKVAGYRIIDRHGAVVAGPGRVQPGAATNLRGNARSARVRLDDCHEPLSPAA